MADEMPKLITPEDYLILVVDDVSANLQLMGAMLDAAGFTTAFATSGHQGLERVQTAKPDLILLDLMMPEMTGLEMCQQLKADSKTASIPIIFLTASQDKQDLLQAFALGAADYITKPFIREEVLVRIRNQLHLQSVRQQLETHNQQLQCFGSNLKALHRLNTTNYDSFEQIFADYLKTGCELFGLAMGIVSAIEGDDYQIYSIYAKGQELQAGDVVAVRDTYCAQVIAQQVTVSYPHVSQIAGMPTHPFYQTLGLESYIGTPIWVQDNIYGTLNFSALQPRSQPFTSQEIDTIELMAQSLGKYIVAHQLEQERQAIAAQKDKLLAIASHELRTPLTSIHGSIQLLISGELGRLSPKAQRLVEIAEINTDRLIRLINDLLNLERLESGQMKMTKQPCEVLNLATQAIEVMQSLAQTRNITLSLDASDSESDQPFIAWADPDRILQTLTNLLSNAIKFSPPQRQIRVSVNWDDFSAQTDHALDPSQQIIVRVQDQGRGIPAHKLERIFERFQQVDPKHDALRHQGTGLGLAICREIIKYHQGQIWVESTSDQGTTFAFTLPAANVAAPAMSSV